MVKTGWFRMPRPLSLAVAAFNVFSVLAQSVVLCLPPVNPIAAENMNWASVISGFLLIVLVVLYWMYARKRYEYTDAQLAVDYPGSTEFVHSVDGKAAEVEEPEKSK